MHLLARLSDGRTDGRRVRGPPPAERPNETPARSRPPAGRFFSITWALRSGLSSALRTSQSGGPLFCERKLKSGPSAAKLVYFSRQSNYSPRPSATFRKLNLRREAEVVRFASFPFCFDSTTSRSRPVGGRRREEGGRLLIPAPSNRRASLFAAGRPLGHSSRRGGPRDAFKWPPDGPIETNDCPRRTGVRDVRISFEFRLFLSAVVDERRPSRLFVG